LGIAVELEITSQVADFFNQIISFLAYGGSSIVKTLNQTSFHFRRMVGVEVQVSASVGWFSTLLATPKNTGRWKKSKPPVILCDI
jgi:hypothetical protein